MSTAADPSESPVHHVRGGLAGQLRAATAQAHQQAESSVFVAALVAGGVPLRAFAALVANHRAIYAALETTPPTWTSDPVAGPFLTLAGLPRLARLEADLAALEVVDPDGEVTAPTRAYVDRIRSVVERDRPDLWLAHHYVRYLGDVSGGQVVAQAVRRGYGADGAAATGFYDFAALGPAPRFRERYRSLLDAAPVRGPDAVIAEAVDAFHRNRAVFAALSARFPT